MLKFLKLVFVLLLWVGSTALSAKTSHLAFVKINYDSLKYGEQELDYFKVTLFNENFTDSILLNRYQNCLVLKGQLPQYNGTFLYYDKKINYSWVRVEHPRYDNQLLPLNTEVAQKDSVDEFNKRHHILFHITEVDLEETCMEQPGYDYLFWSNGVPYGGYLYPNQIGVLLKDSMGADTLRKIAQNHDLNYQSVSYNGKVVIFNQEKKLKKKKNKGIVTLLEDSNLVEDAGFMLDTNTYLFASSFHRVCGVTIKEIEKRKLKPIGGLQSLAVETMYIREKELEMGCGLYRYDLGMGYWIFDYAAKLKDEELKDKCYEQSKWAVLDKEYHVLHTWNFSISGGSDKGKKKANNEKRMMAIHEEQKELMKQYKAPFAFVEPIIISPEN